MKKSHIAAATFLLYSALYAMLSAYSEESLLIKRLGNALGDTQLKVRYASESLPSSREKLVIIAVDEESSSKLDLRWPWPRSVFARMVEELRRKGVAVIGLNFTFSGLEAGDETSTQALADAISSQGRVVVGSTLDGDRILKPNALLLRAGARYGYLEKIVDDDFVIRRSYLWRPYRSGGEEPSFPLVLWRSQDAADPSLEGWANKDGAYPINYLAKESDFKTISAWKLLEGKVGEESLRGKTVILGISSSLLTEKHYTPLGLMSGLFVHANEWLGLEERRKLTLAPAATGAWVGWILGGVLLWLFLIRRFWEASIGYVTTLFLLFLVSQWAVSRDVVLPLFLMCAGPLLSLAAGVASHLFYLFMVNQGLEKKVIQDKMTGLYTYDYLRLRLEDEWKRCSKLLLPVSIVMTDLDRFKKINDTLGHETGNQMILRAAAVIKESARGYDVVSRYGGDEFVILLWHSGEADAHAYRQRLRQSYEAMARSLEETRLQDSSISIGVASFDPRAAGLKPKNPQELIEMADKDLFRDKESRRKPGESAR